MEYREQGRKAAAESVEQLPVRREFLGIKINAVTMSGVLSMCGDAIRRNRCISIGCLNAAKIVRMRSNKELRRDVLGSDIIVADGVPVIWAGQLLGQPLPERVNGTDLFEALLEEGERNGWSVYLLGATPEVLSRLVDVLRRVRPELRLAGYRDGYFREEESGDVAAEIRTSGANLLFVGITSPKKERFLAEWSPTLGVNVLHGVGGSFDVLAGVTRRAPVLWQRFGLEWLYRVLQEPRRMWKRYVFTNTVFVGMVLIAMLDPSTWRRKAGMPMNRKKMSEAV